MADKTVILELGADTSGFDSGLKRASGIFSRFSSQMMTQSGGITSALRGVSKALMGAFAIRGLVNFSKDSITASATFETSMNKIGSILDGTSEQLEGTLKGMGDSLKNISKETGTAVADLAEATYQAISSGQSAGDAVAFVEDANKLAIAGFTSTTNAVDILTTAINSYGAEVLTADKISDWLIKTQNKGKITVDEMTETYGKLIPIAKNANVSFEQMSAGMAILTKEGVSASYAGTYLKSMFSELSKTGSKADKILQNIYGKSFPELMQGGMTVGDVLRDMSKYGEENNLTLRDMFGRLEASTASLILAGDEGEKFNKMLADMNATSGDTEKAFEKMMNGIGRQMMRASAHFELFKIAVGDALSPFVEGILNVALPIMDDLTMKLNEWTEGIDREALVDIVEEWATLLGTTLVKSIEAVSAVLSELWEDFKKGTDTKDAKDAIEKLNTALQWIIDNADKVASGIQLIVKAFMLFKALSFLATIVGMLDRLHFSLVLFKNSKVFAKIAGGVKGLAGGVKALAGAFSLAVAGVLALAGGLLALGIWISNNGDKWAKVGDTISRWEENVNTALDEAWANMKQSWSDTTTSMSEGWSQYCEDVKQWWSDAEVFVEGLQDRLNNYIQGKVDEIASWYQTKLDNISEWWSDLGTDVETVHGKINTAVDKAWDKVVTTVRTKMESARKAVDKAVERIKGLMDFEWSIPRPKIPSFSISGSFGLSPPSVPSINFAGWKASGGIATSPSIVGIGEAGAEAILPLSNKSKMKPFASAVAQMMPNDSSADGRDIVNNYNIASLVIREEADIKKLAKAITKEQEKHIRAGGRVIYGIQI